MISKHTPVISYHPPPLLPIALEMRKTSCHKTLCNLHFSTGRERDGSHVVLSPSRIHPPSCGSLMHSKGAFLFGNRVKTWMSSRIYDNSFMNSNQGETFHPFHIVIYKIYETYYVWYNTDCTL